MSCDKCVLKQGRINALEKVMGKLQRGEDAFNWVGHEIGMRRKTDDLEAKVRSLRKSVMGLSKKFRSTSGSLDRLTKVLKLINDHWFVGFFARRMKFDV